MVLRRFAGVSRYAAGAALCCAIFGCDITTVVFTEGYTMPPSAEPPSLAVYYSGEIAVNYQGNVEDDFGTGDKDQLIRNFVKKQIMVAIRTNTVFKSTRKAEPAGSYATREILLEVTGKSDMTFRVPREGTRVPFDEARADFVLFIGDLSVVSHFKLSENSQPTAADQCAMAGLPDGALGYGPPIFRPPVMNPPHGWQSFNPSKDLILEGRFALWDNIQGTLVCYGYVQAIDENSFAVSKADWIDVCDLFVKKAFEGLPFVRGSRF